MAVLAVIVILGAVLIPTLSGSRGDTQTKAGADVVQTYIAKARAKAIEDGRPYRLALSADGTQVQITPDVEDDGTPHDDDDASIGARHCEDTLPDGVKAVIVISDEDFTAQDQSGWQRVATFLPNGTCREEQDIELRIQEQGVAPVTIRIRSVTGSCVATRGGSSP
jgi:type II secretory pathway pseudopilin PulG